MAFDFWLRSKLGCGILFGLYCFTAKNT